MTQRKILTVFISVAITLCLLLGVSAFGLNAAYAAQSDVTALELVYDQTDKTVVVGATVPEGVTGNVKVVVPEGVTAIAAHAFDEIDNLTEAQLPSTLTSIGAYAFAGTALTSVNIPASVTLIAEHAFNGCAALTGVTFARGRTNDLTVAIHAFASCSVLGVIEIPANTTVKQNAFVGCTALLWAYVGEGCTFDSVGVDNAVFFPTNTSVSVVFPSKSAYDKTVADSDEAFVNNNGKSCKYVVNVNCYVGGSATPVVYQRLNGCEFNYVKDSNGIWNTDTAFSVLPAQHASYASTVWYSDKALTNVASYAKVNELLATETAINLYCHETVLAPEMPAEPVSWVYSEQTSYDISDITQVLQAMGCNHNYTPAQLSAVKYSVLFADENGNPAEVPDAINVSGVYSVALTLDPSYGEWAQTYVSAITVNVDTSGFNIVLIVFLIVSALALIATTATAIIRKKVQDRNKKKQLSQKEVLEKFRAAGGETTIIK